MSGQRSVASQVSAPKVDDVVCARNFFQERGEADVASDCTIGRDASLEIISGFRIDLYQSRKCHRIIEAESL